MTKDDILGLVSDVVSNFMYYDRKNCEDFPVGSIEDAIESGVVTVDELAARFAIEIRNAL